MTKPALESKHEKDLTQAVTQAGGLCLKLPAILYRGIPDRLVLLPGARIYFLELKRAGATTKKSTAVHQSRFKKTLSSMGFVCDRIEGPDQLNLWIQTHVS